MSKKTFIGEDGKEYVAKIKKPFYKRWWFIALVVIVIINLFAGGGNDTSDTASDTQVTNNVVEEAEADETETQNVENDVTEFNIGDLITTDNFEFTITSRETSEVITDESGFLEHTADGTYLIVNVDYENVSNEAQTLDNSSFKVVVDGSEYSPTNLFLDDDDISFDTINPGIAKSGNLYFDVPEDVANRNELLLVLSSSIFSQSGNAEVNLK